MNHDAGDEAALRKIQQDWADARLKRDSSFPKKIEADNFTVVWFDGRIVDKEDLQTYESEDAVFTEFKIDDLKMRFYGDTAIVVGEGSIKARTKNSGFERQIHLDRHIRKTKRRMEGSRIAGDFSLGEMIASCYP